MTSTPSLSAQIEPIPWHCRIRLHRWGKWSEPDASEYTDDTGRRFIFQWRECTACGKAQWREC